MSDPSEPRGPRDLPDGACERLAGGLLALFFPESCLVCRRGDVARRRQFGVCDPCWERVVALELAPPWCPSCGVPSGPLASPGDLCLRCLLDPPPFAGARALGSHAGGLRRLVHALKFEGRRNVARLLGSRLAAAFARSWRPGEIDAIVPIPLHAERERRRGYNQSALLARELAPYLGIPVLAGALRRPRRTRPQVGLSLGERQRNLRGAFAAEVRGPLAGARILLVDDVVTTGATAESAAGALLDAGAARVSVLAVARTLGGPD